MLRRCTAVLCLLFVAGCGGNGSNSPSPQPVQNAVPSVSSVSPSSLLAGSGDVALTVNGTGFLATSTVQWNGVALATTFTSSTALGAVLPAADVTKAGSGSLTVVSPAPGGGSSAQVALAINNPAPMIGQISPATVTAGGGPVTLDVKGSGFVSTSQLSWNGTALPTNVVSASELTATLAANLIAGSAADQVTVNNPSPGGGSTPVQTYNVTSPTPVISAIVPRVLPVGAATTVTVKGSGFETNSTVLWNGAARPTAFVDAGTLQGSLTAADLSAAGKGSLSVSNPGPGATASAAAPVTVSSEPFPTITGMTIFKSNGVTSSCPQLVFNLNGDNLTAGSTVQVNGTTLTTQVQTADAHTIVGALPSGFYSKAGGLSVTVTTSGDSPLVSDPFMYAPDNGPAYVLCPAKGSVKVYPESSFTLGVTLTAVNATGAEQVSVSGLPAGVTAGAQATPIAGIAVPLHFQATAAAVAGSYQMTLATGSGKQAESETLPLTVASDAAPILALQPPLSREVGVPLGGSATITFSSRLSSPDNTLFDVTPSITGLPPKVTAAFSPSVFSPGDSVTVTLAAASDAAVAQNLTVTLVGTPSAKVAPASSDFLLDVTLPPGTGSNNRTDFVPLAGTPYAAVYDAAHKLIFASNPDWNRVDVLSSTTHQLVQHIPVHSPRGLDLTQDGTRVWVQTASRSLYAIDTASLQTSAFQLPNTAFLPSGNDVRAGLGTNRLWALADGTLFLYYDDYGVEGSARVGVWNPQTGDLKALSSGNSISAWSLPVRSGDGSLVYATNDLYDTGIEVYEARTQSLKVLGAGTGFQPVVAVNRAGTRLVISDAQGLGLYDNGLNRLGTVPGALSGFGIGFPLDGGVLFSPDDTQLITVGQNQGLNEIVTTDAATLQVKGTAPALFTDPVGTSGYPGLTTPVAVDASGLVIGIQNYGIAFEDATSYQNYVAGMSIGNGEGEFIATYAGPLAGGPVSLFGEYGPLVPDVWFGQLHGSATSTGTDLSLTAPPSPTPGPVNVKLLFPDGAQHFYPQVFSYGTNPEYAVASGSGPEGGAAGTVLGYGLPQDVSGGSVTIGGNQAVITTKTGQYPPLSGEPYPSTLLYFTFPPGQPGWADLNVSSPIGAGTLAKSILYAKEITDYASADTFQGVLLDRKRNQLYLSAGDHIDVFSLSSRQFLSPLRPAAGGASSSYAGMALTPDGTQLLAANLLDGSLAVISPDNPGSSFSLPIAKPVVMSPTCTLGPLYVAATSTNEAVVVTGGLPGSGCVSEGLVYVVNLQARTVSPANTSPGCSVGGAFTNGFSAEATADGNTVAIGASTYSGACLYSAAASSFTPVHLPAGNGGITISADGNVVGSARALADPSSGSFLGSVSLPIPLYGNTVTGPTATSRLHPRLNDSGSLYYFAYPNWFEVVDVQHALLRLRFALTQTVQDVPLPIAIDAGGRSVYLVTDKGLTLVDLGSAPLSVGHLSQTAAAAGTQVVARGSGFDATTTVTLGGSPAVAQVTDENTMTFTVPALSAGVYDLVLTRGDGQVYTLNSGLVVP